MMRSQRARAAACGRLSRRRWRWRGLDGSGGGGAATATLRQWMTAVATATASRRPRRAATATATMRLRRWPTVVATATERLRQRPAEAATGRRTSRKTSGTSAPRRLRTDTSAASPSSCTSRHWICPRSWRRHRRSCRLRPATGSQAAGAAAEVARLLAHLGDVASRRTLARRRLLLAPVFGIQVEAAGVKGGKGAGGWRRRRRRRGSTVPDRQVDARRVHHWALARVPDHPQRRWPAASGGLGQRDAVCQEAARRVEPARLGRPLAVRVCA